MDAYNTHLEQMKNGYLDLFEREVGKKAEEGPLRGIYRVAQVETIDDLINLEFVNKGIEKEDYT